MENASEALIMAGSVLLLIIALSLCISSFSRVKTQIDDIIISRDQVQYAVDSDNNLINFIQSNGNYTRTVQMETVVTTLRRIRKESFSVYIILKNTINLSTELEELKTKLIQDEKFDNIEYHKDFVVIKFSLSGEANKFVEDKNSENFDKAIGLLYNIERDAKFKEYYGIYQEKTDEGVSTYNKRDIKIITYVEQ